MEIQQKPHRKDYGRFVTVPLRSLQGSLRMFALLLILALLAACGSETAAGSGQDQALIDAPAVGDLYAAELTYFSEADFEGQPRAYGLMKVISVAEDKITVITENAASADEAVPRKEITGGLENIEFDDSERIDILQAQLLEAHRSGKIFAVRRLGG